MKSVACLLLFTSSMWAVNTGAEVAKVVQFGGGIQRISWQPRSWGQDVVMKQLNLKLGLTGTRWYADVNVYYSGEPDGLYEGPGGFDTTPAAGDFRNSKLRSNEFDQTRYVWRGGVFLLDRFTLFGGYSRETSGYRHSRCCRFDQQAGGPVSGAAGTVEKRMDTEEGGVVLGAGVNFRYEKNNLALWAAYGQWDSTWRNRIVDGRGVTSVLADADVPVGYRAWSMKWSYFLDHKRVWSLTVSGSKRQYQAQGLDFGLAAPMQDFDSRRLDYRLDYTRVF